MIFGYAIIHTLATIAQSDAQEQIMPPIYVIGDIHGQYDKLCGLLQGAGLIDENLNWTGDKARLWLLGDFVDRGPGGVASIELIMQLQNAAADAGGQVQSVLGNHDLLLLAVYHFGRYHDLLIGTCQSARKLDPKTLDFFTGNWLQNGGQITDYCGLRRKHVTWLANLPALARVQDKILAHADSAFYQRYGDTVEQVNTNFAHVLHNGTTDDWIRLLDAFSEHKAFLKTDGPGRAALFLKIFQGEQLVHGHTPINALKHEPATEPMVYANGLCVNVDGGMYLGGDGFVYQLA
jgi:hypothetical protein